ncbi:MAG: hypothetical protein GZ091_03635 [Paludibacter sp.]|nr:hypothetical protein [Paludibacter sp.]
MKSFIYLFFLSAIFSISLYSCYYDKEELLYPTQAACDTTNVTYALKVAPIFSANCTSCHNESSPGGGIQLQNYGVLKTNINQSYDAIVKGRMPKDGGKLDDCSISTVRIWKNAGALNN